MRPILLQPKREYIRAAGKHIPEKDIPGKDIMAEGSSDNDKDSASDSIWFS